MARSEFSAKTKVAAFDRCGGKCEECTARLSPGNIEYDHIIPDALGGDNSLENCQCLCRNCHGAKTRKKDVPQIAKAKRVRTSHVASKTKRGPAIPGSKRSGWKRPLNGPPIRRE